MIEEDVIERVNLHQRQYGWRATNYSKFWGRKAREGLVLRTGTLNPEALSMRMHPIHLRPDVSHIPRYFDARNKREWQGRVSGVSDQGWCGASWAFSTLGVTQDRFLNTPFKAGEIADLENVQRTFTACITEIKHLSYWERLKFLNLYSLECRWERYMIIYTWKILEGLVPNLHMKITRNESKRLCRQCNIPPMKSRGVTSTLKDNTISVRGLRLFNCLPAYIKGITNRPLAVFKQALDKHLKSVPDQPGCGSYVGLHAASSNSLVDQALIHQEAWSQTGLWGR
nr:uncharacterized protein LOC128705576 [Cherax quadricarinatus]